MTRNKKIGIGLLVSPWVLLIAILISYVAVEMRIHYYADKPYIDGYEIRVQHPEEVKWKAVKVVLGQLSMVNFLYLLVGTGLGIYFLVKKDILVSNN